MAAEKRRVGGKGSEDEEFAGFRETFRQLDEVTRAAVSISERNIGKTHTGRQRRALFVLSKLICHNMSALNIAQKHLDEPVTGLLDHFSIGVLGRASIDAALMTMYISEPRLTRTQWDLRRHILFFHDINNRSRFLKPGQKFMDFPFFENKDEVRDGLISRIEALGRELALGDQKIEELKRGFNVFIDGVRGAVREAGWDIDFFEFLQSYLSSYVHTHPVSFIRADEHGVRFSGASKFQLAFCQSTFIGVTAFTKDVVARMEEFSIPETGDPNGHLE